MGNLFLNSIYLANNVQGLIFIVISQLILMDHLKRTFFLLLGEGVSMSKCPESRKFELPLKCCKSRKLFCIKVGGWLSQDPLWKIPLILLPYQLS